MNIQEILSLVIVISLVVVALYFRPLRKAIGLLIVILGGLASMTVIGLVVGVPMIIVGGFLLFIK